jgi:hypothetical protein
MPDALAPVVPDLSHISLTATLAAMRRKKYKIYDAKDYALNVVGVRRTEIRVNEFNDLLLVFYPLKKQWMHAKYQITTLPGLTYLAERLKNSRGVAILAPGQYADKYMIRPHNGQYEAFCQKPDVSVQVYRDNNLNGKLEIDPATLSGARGINIHRAEPEGCTAFVNSYSAGCQVFRCAAQFQAFMAIVRAARKAHGNSFAYTLLDEADLK